MKKIIIIGVVLVLVILGISYFINNPINPNSINSINPINTGDGVNASQQSVEYSKNGIKLLMPGDWVSANSKSNETILAVADPNSKDSSGFNDVNVNIEKKSNARSLDSEFKSNYNILARNSDFNILFEGNSSFNGEPAMEADYTSVSDGVLKEHKAIWVQKDSDIYVILCSAPESEFDEKLNTFDFIINSIQL